jgi:hypothetical protein
VHHRRRDEWHRLLTLVESLARGEPAVENIADHFPRSLPQTKRNEDALDAFVAAYVDAYSVGHLGRCEDGLYRDARLESTTNRPRGEVRCRVHGCRWDRALAAPRHLEGREADS